MFKSLEHLLVANSGYLFGMHHRLIVAMIKKEELPEAPKGKCPFA